MKVLSSIISLSLWQTVVSAAGHDEDPVSSFISQRRNLFLKNAAKHGVTRSSISSKESDANAKENMKAFLSSLHGKKVSDSTACSDAYEKMYEAYYFDLDIFEFAFYEVIMDGIYTFSIEDQSAFDTYTDACEALDGRVMFLNYLADSCYYEKYDEDFNPTGEVYYTQPLETLYHMPDCIPNACSTNKEIANTLESMFDPTDYGDNCNLKIEVSEEETTEEKLGCINATVEILFDETMWTDEFFNSTVDYDEDTNTMSWIGSDEDLASFDTACQALDGSTYLTSASSDECYYYDYYEEKFLEEKFADWIRLPDCIPNTCSSTKDAVDTLEMLYGTPNCDSLKIKLDIPSGCKDSGVKMLLKRDGVTKKRGCEWILRKEALREKRCGLKEVASHCPSTCHEVTTPNSCEEYSCEDSKMKWTRWGKHEKVLDCDWVKEHPEKRCKKKGVAATCRKTCGYKSDFLDCSN